MTKVNNKSINQIKWKLLFTYLIVMVTGIGVVILLTRQLTISSYSQHIQQMSQLGMGGMMGDGTMMGNDVATELTQSFRDTLNLSLLWSALAAGGVAVVLSIVISRHFTRPIHDMAAVTGRIAEGDYSQRVAVNSGDEIGSLAGSLNSMAGSLEESQRMRRELMANIAHELRTPLTSISGYMEGLADGVVPSTPETFELVGHEARRMSRLVDDLQRLSRAESGQEKLDIVDLDVAPFLERLVRKMDPPYREKGVRLSLAAGPGLQDIKADEDKLDQVLVNLLDNALRYTDNGGRVSIEAGRLDGAVQISVQDSGIGISPEDLPHVFERFYRTDKSRSRAQGGSGIGLTIARRYARSLGGDISVTSNQGGGSRFTVTLPAS